MDELQQKTTPGSNPVDQEHDSESITCTGLPKLDSWRLEEENKYVLNPGYWCFVCVAAEPRTQESVAATGHTVSYTTHQNSSNQEEELHPGPGVCDCYVPYTQMPCCLRTTYATLPCCLISSSPRRTFTHLLKGTSCWVFPVITERQWYSCHRMRSGRDVCSRKLRGRVQCCLKYHF